jgi:mannose-1-phosphate guanylyltransferase
MKALILVGGLGTRMRPLTYTRPKHLLPIANRPHLEHVLDMLVASNVREAVLLTSYLAEAFASVQQGAFDRGLNLDVTHEEEALDTAGALKNAEMLVGDETFLVVNGDILSDIDLRPVVEWHRARSAEGTIVLTPVADPSAYGVVPTDDGGKVLGFIEKPPPGEAPTNMINAGVYVLEPSIMESIPAGRRYNAERELFPELASNGSLFALPTDAYWMDIGTPEKYLQANLDALAGRFKTNAVSSMGDGRVLADEGVVVAATARVSESALGAGARIEDLAEVLQSVLLPNAVVGKGARVEGCVVGEGATIVANTQLAGAAIADGEEIS